MKKSKKKVVIAILCVAINMILLSQLLFASVSALYDSVTSLVSGEEVVCCAGHGLEPGVVELEPVVAMSSGCEHSPSTTVTPIWSCPHGGKITSTTTVCSKCGILLGYGGVSFGCPQNLCTRP